jgi:hypothetical protein
MRRLSVPFARAASLGEFAHYTSVNSGEFFLSHRNQFLRRAFCGVPVPLGQ